MANYNSLKATINADIKTNHEQEITGSILNSVLIGMVDNLAAGYLFKGVATPATNPGTPDQNVYYIAGAGTYTHFNNTTIDDGEVGVFLYNGAWTVERMSLASTNFLTISTDVPDLGYDEADPHTIAELMGQSIDDVLATGAVRFVGDVVVSYYKVIGRYGAEGGYITFIGVDNIYQYDVNADGYITDTKVTSLAPDDELSENSENAIQNKVVKAAMDAMDAAKQDVLTFDNVPTEGSTNPVTSGGIKTALDEKANIDGQYDTLTSGYAGNLIDKSDNGSEQQIMFRKTGGTTEVAASTRAMFKRLLGRSLVWNQQCANGDFADNSNINSMSSGTYIVSNGICEVTPDVNSNSGISRKMSEMAKPNNHKFYIRFEHQGAAIKVSTFNIGSFDVPQHDSMTKCSHIVTVGSESFAFDLVYLRNKTGGVFRLKNTICIDLSLMYGAGYEPATVAEFESIYNKPYYPHCTAAFIHNVAQTYEAIGFNQWDEEWEIGTLNYDGTITSGSKLCSKNFIPIIPGATYYFKIPFACFYAAYDANKVNLLPSSAWLYALNNSGAVTFGNDVHYIKLGSVDNKTTYNHDICINLSNTDINGAYAPYIKATATLGLSAFRVKDSQGNITTIHGLKGTGAAYDEIDTEGKRYIERVEMRAYQSGDDSDASVLTDGTNTLAPLAVPVVYDLVDDVPTDCQTWGVGTENILPEGVDENGVPKTTPLRAVIYYPKDYTGTINNLPKNYISKDSLTNMLNALKSAGIIRSFTMIWNAETQTYNFTIS